MPFDIDPETPFEIARSGACARRGSPWPLITTSEDGTPQPVRMVPRDRPGSCSTPSRTRRSCATSPAPARGAAPGRTTRGSDIVVVLGSASVTDNRRRTM